MVQKMAIFTYLKMSLRRGVGGSKKAKTPFRNLKVRVTSLEQLSVAELSGKKTRPKVCKNSNEKILVVLLDSVSNVKIWENKVH